MSVKEYKEYIYVPREDYDTELKLNGEELEAYSKKKLKELYPNKDFEIAGETFEKKKRDRKSDIGRIELNDKRLYVATDGKHSKLFKKQAAFVQVQGGGFIALLKTRLLPFILMGALLAGGVGAALYCGLGNGGSLSPSGDELDPGIVPVANEILTVSGSVSSELQGIEGAQLSLQSGNTEVARTSTDKDGKFLIGNVKNGIYNLVCSYGDSVLSKIAIVDGMSAVVDFVFPADDLHDVEDITGHHVKEDLPQIKDVDGSSDVKALVKVASGSPAIAAGGVDSEAMLNMIAGKEVDLTLLAEKLDEGKVPSADKNAITAISGELEMSYYDFSLLKEVFANHVLESSEYLKNSKSVLEIAVPYDSSKAVGAYVFRYHDDAAFRFQELESKPAGNFQDGTYYVSLNTVYVYTDCFSTFAIGSASAGHVVKGVDTVTYSDKATINLASKQIDMMYKHDADSSNDARIELYIVGEKGKLLVAQSGVIPVGYSLSAMTLLSNIKNMPSVGTYNGLMKVIYLGIDGDTSTNVEIPLSIAITQ